MKNTSLQILTAGILAFSAVFVGSIAITNNIKAATHVGCRCGVLHCDGSCGIGRLLRRRSVACPSCDAEICELKSEETKEKKTCYKVEQKTVCIPTVRLPWQACAPTTSSSRRINVLKKHSYECPSCKHTWSVIKPEAAPEPKAPTKNLPPIEPSINSGAINMSPLWPKTKPVSSDSQKANWNLFRMQRQDQTSGYPAFSPRNFIDNSELLNNNN